MGGSPGGDPDTVLTVDLDLPDEAIAQYEWVQEPSFGYREFLIPAVVVNRHRRIAEVEWDIYGTDAWARLYGSS